LFPPTAYDICGIVVTWYCYLGVVAW